MGVPYATYRADGNYSSDVSGGPVLPARLFVYFQSVDPSSVAVSISYEITLTYHVEFISPKLQLPS